MTAIATITAMATDAPMYAPNKDAEVVGSTCTVVTGISEKQRWLCR